MRSYVRNKMNTLMNKSNAANLMVIVALLLSACKSGSEKEQAHQHDEYTCPMHPQIVQDKPGSCPVCGMDLVKKSNGGNEITVTEDLRDLIKPTNSSVVSAIQTIHPEKKTMTVKVSAPGAISYDTRRTYSIPVRFSGRIEKLYLKYNYQPVKKAQVIMDIYSPELVTAQRELLYVVKEQKEDDQLLKSSKEKLFLLGLTEDQVDNIITTGKETFAIPVLSPYSGYIVESTNAGPLLQPSVESGAIGMGGGGMNAKGGNKQLSTAMNGSSSAASSGEQISIREGMYVTTGQSLFKVIDGTRLWAELYFASSEGVQIQKGETIKLIVKGSEIEITSRVDFIQPFFTEGKQFLQVRSYLIDDRNNLRVGQLVTAQIEQTHNESLWVPKKAVLDLGIQQIIFLKSDRTFTPFKVKTGLESEGWIEITGGLEESSEIASNAQYLVDSESFIKISNP